MLGSGSYSSGILARLIQAVRKPKLFAPITSQRFDETKTISCCPGLPAGSVKVGLLKSPSHLQQRSAFSCGGDPRDLSPRELVHAANIASAPLLACSREAGTKQPHRTPAL